MSERRARGAIGRSRPMVWARERAWPWFTLHIGSRVMPVLRAIWKVVGPTLSTVSGFGWAVLTATVLALVAGAVFGWRELLIVAFVLLAALLIAVGFAIGRSAYAVRLDLALSRVVVGERAVGRIAVTNTSARSLLPARIELPVGSSFAAFHLPRLAPQAEHDDLFGIPTHRRSVIQVGPVRSVRGDPLGLMRREIRWTEPRDLFVHPRTVALGGSSSGFLRDLEGIESRVLSDNDVSFHALREYVPGDDRRYIHWKTSARTGKLMVRQFEETRRSHLAIGLSTNRSDYAETPGDDPDYSAEFELAVSICGSLGVQALREEFDLTVLTQRSELQSETGRRLLDELSGVAQTERREAIAQLAKTLGSSVPDASVAFFVFGSTVTPSQLQAATVHVPLGVRVLAVSCRPGAQLSLREIGETSLLTVGDLSDFPLALRRANS
ncbi:DUF58 domain-containing protein [Herbiconiux sp. CPCC 203407]|uniref:DUF58 domain-containing protein n=1 Tax=Herbiconiux oxytropis TaxID=2970915 RepID=A0AA41XB32_9MICO|nr:DUF58 domain-containing protein [Herbiconiux oxytropis]MCS5720714.1 DUF58 domain-containing protein [Herbiconiux oxytropis]MCS5724959.1 DUF58 domain-containing protein [Herbiconiux oxytropis]